MKDRRAGTCLRASSGLDGRWILLLLPLFAGDALNSAGMSLRAAERAVAVEDLLQRPIAPSTLERMPLRDVLDILVRPHGVVIFLDRRINPDTRVSMKLTAAPLREVLEKLGDAHGFSLSLIEGVIYLGPESTAQQLRTRDRLRREEARDVGPTLTSALFKTATLEWPDLASPQELVIQVCRDAGLSLSNPESIPHDLWAAGRLRNIPRIAQLTVLLAGFDLTFELGDDGMLTVRPVIGCALWTHVYPIAPRHMGMVDQIGKTFPDVQLNLQRSQLQVTGLVEEHEVIRQWLLEGRRPSPSPIPQERTASEGAAARYTLRVVRRPLREVLQEIERTTPYRFAYDPMRLEEDEGPLGQAISFEVQQADIDGLLQALFEPVGLSWHRAGYKVELTPAGGGEKAVRRE